MSAAHETYSIERHGLESVVLKKIIPEEKYTTVREFWYSAKEDKWWNFITSECLFTNTDDCKFYYNKFIMLAGDKILFSTTIKEKTITNAIIELIEKFIERL